MRRVAIDDLLNVASHLNGVPPQMRLARVLTLCERAHLGDKIRKRLGRVSPYYGSGTLGGGQSGTSEQRWNCVTLSVAARGVELWRTQQRQRGGGCNY
jgi:hypothetical protein